MYISANGSHRKYRNLAALKSVIIPYHSGDLKSGTVNSILKQAGLK
ncbi:MAG: type II toxin-antitoxin system HicA family toxin [Oscillospiraceae bacterium]|nr:type II toxin-antitoxin system HicA family toxin [Oscillospiraceae bacterium]